MSMIVSQAAQARKHQEAAKRMIRRQENRK